MKALQLSSTFLVMISATHAAMTSGDVISIDFGATAPATENWNQFTYDEVSTAVTVGNLIRLSDGAETGVSIEVAGFTVNSGTGNSIYNLEGSGSRDATIYEDGIFSNGPDDDTLVVTFYGLDDSLEYALSGGFVRQSQGHAITWKVGEQVVDCLVEQGRVDGYVSFAGLSPIGGVLTLSISDYSNKSAAIISELTLTASSKVTPAKIPEPASFTLWAGLLGMSLAMRRRRFR